MLGTSEKASLKGDEESWGGALSNSSSFICHLFKWSPFTVSRRDSFQNWIGVLVFFFSYGGIKKVITGAADDRHLFKFSNHTAPPWGHRCLCPKPAPPLPSFSLTQDMKELSDNYKKVFVFVRTKSVKFCFFFSFCLSKSIITLYSSTGVP